MGKYIRMQGCRGTYDFGVASVSGVNIEIDRGTAWPGVYSIQLPVKLHMKRIKGIMTVKWRRLARIPCIHEIFFSGRL